MGFNTGNSFPRKLRERREITLSIQKPQLARVTGQLTNKIGIYLLVVFSPNPIQKGMANPIPNFGFSPFLGCWPNSTK